MVMKAKIRLEDDIIRWYHVRMGIYSTVLVFSVMIFPMETVPRG